MESPRVAILGAGIAGLTAADWLSCGGCEVTIFEARSRAGGRLYTLYPDIITEPIELGAEFVHGDRQETWRAAKNCEAFNPEPFPDVHWEWRDDEFVKNPHFWEDLDEVMGGMDRIADDESFSTYLWQIRHEPKRLRALARDYVEGFHAASPQLVGVRSLDEAEEEAERSHGQQSFRVPKGYGAIVDWFVAKLKRRRNVSFHFNAIVNKVRWSRGRVEVFTVGESIPPAPPFDAVLITLPLGVLQAAPGQVGAIRFEPELHDSRALINELRMGNVIKLTFAFREAILPSGLFGFLHAHDHAFPTWWSGPGDRRIVAWTGGPKADALNDEPADAIVDVALDELSHLLQTSKHQLDNQLERTFWHDWRNDPFTRGAYSYLPVGTTDLPKRIADPVEQTLFFAGEALAPPGQDGTVHGAIASAKTTAMRMLTCFQ